jgi:hypothetical protein
MSVKQVPVRRFMDVNIFAEVQGLGTTHCRRDGKEGGRRDECGILCLQI